jgi:hypothetical protein
MKQCFLMINCAISFLLLSCYSTLLSVLWAEKGGRLGMPISAPSHLSNRASSYKVDGLCLF